MKCKHDNFTTENKKSFSNHMRWHKGLMKKESFLGINKADKNGQWKGDNVGYHAVHAWVNKHITLPKVCVNCRSEKNIDLANISQKYKRALSDWEYLCRSCHMYKDGRLEALHNLHKQHA